MYWSDDFPKRKEDGRMKTKPPHVRLGDPAHFQSGCPADDFGRGEDLKLGLHLASEYITAMSDEAGAWQHNQTPLTDKLMRVMRETAYTDRIEDWPTNETINGYEKRDLSRLGSLFRIFERAAQDVFLAPLKWQDQDVIANSHFYKEWTLEIREAQFAILRIWSPATAVPLFDLARAAGNAGHWNYLPTNQTKGGKKEKKPPITTGQPDPDMFEEFLRSRTTEENETLRDLFSTRESGSDGWERYKFRKFDGEKLPDRSDGPHAYGNWGKSEWITYHHGIKMEALYAILAGIEKPSGGLKASGDRESGQRFNQENGRDKKGVYFHTEKDKGKALSYAHWVPLFGGNGCYVQVSLECVVDRNYRIPYTHPNQKLQMPNCDSEIHGSDYIGGPSIYYKYMHVRILGYQDLPHESTYSMIWNPGMEARSDHINRLHGTNQDEGLHGSLPAEQPEGSVDKDQDK
jgi:hypothetical protein